MKYDRPVWQLMHACADAMPETFSFDDVRAWFAENYPEVGVATIRAHVVGLTDGGAKHPQFQRRSPLFRRVSRGVYAPIPFEERGELPEDDPSEAASAPGRFTPAEHSEEREEPEGKTGSGMSAPGPDEISAEGFWTFLEEQDARDDAMAHESATRRKDEDKAERRRRKAAKREARRQAELETERRRALLDAQDDDAPDVGDDPDPDPLVEPERAEIDAERRRLVAEREEMARIAVERAQMTRQAQREIEAERARLQAERAEAEAERLAVVRREAERAAAAKVEAARQEAERVAAERAAREEKKRANKLRKAARKEREAAEALERDRIERRARRKAERRARESAEQHLRDAAERRRRDEEERHRAAVTVREELARLEEEALARIETERAMRARSEVERAERDRLAFERAEKERIAFEQAELGERDQLEREEQELHLTLRPMLDQPGSPPHAPQPRAAAEPPGRDEPPFESSGEDAPDHSHDDDEPGQGGIVIVRAPRPTAQPDAEDARAPDAPEPAIDRDIDAERTPSDAIVLGSAGERLRVPAPARDAFRDLSFQRARRDAELSGSPWFVLSADHGLLEPGEWMSPDERTVSDIEPRQREAWASWVVARLESLVGELTGLVVQVEAPHDITDLVASALRDAGAEVSTDPIPAAPAEPDPATEAEEPEPAAPAAEPDEEPSADEPDQPGETEQDEQVENDEEDEDGPDAQIIPFMRGGSIAEYLSDPRDAVPAASAGSLPHHPGLYAWSVDHAGARELNRALRLPVGAGVIYVGQVGGSTGLSDSGFSLNDHITRVQLHGRSRASTFRMTLATTLAGLLGLHTIEDPRLTQWMLEHLSISVWPTEDVASLHDLKASVVAELLPELNLDNGRGAEYRHRIAELGARLA